MIIKESPSLLFKGHNYGQYMSSDNTEFAYVPIPKNASSYLKVFFELGWNWNYDFNYYQDSNKKFIVCLRDPIDRWAVGVTEYFYRQHPKMVIKGKTFLDFIFERVYFDEHTMPQCNYVSGLDLNNLICLKFNDMIGTNIDNLATKYFNDETWKTRKLTLILYKNSSDMFIIKQTNLDILKTHLKNNPKYLYTLKEFYKEDYELIENINYYGT